MLCLGCQNDELKWEPVEYYPSGRVLAEHAIEPNTGVVYRREYYDGGELWVTYPVKNGLINGDYLVFHKNGVLASKVLLFDNKEEGLRIDYYPSGNIRLETTYHNGLQNGYKRFYYENSELQSEYYYINDTLYYRKNNLMDSTRGILKTIESFTPRVYVEPKIIRKSDTVNLNFYLPLPQKDFLLDSLSVFFTLVNVKSVNHDEMITLHPNWFEQCRLKNGHCKFRLIIDEAGEQKLIGYIDTNRLDSLKGPVFFTHDLMVLP